MWATRWLAKARMHRGGEAVLGQRDRRFQDRRPGQATVALVQGQPPVDRPGDGHAPDVTTQRHVGVSLGAQTIGIGSGTRPAHGQETHGPFSGGLDHRQHVTTETAEMRARPPPSPRRRPPWRRPRCLRDRAWRSRRRRPVDRRRRPSRAPPRADETESSGSPWQTMSSTRDVAPVVPADRVPCERPPLFGRHRVPGRSGASRVREGDGAAVGVSPNDSTRSGRWCGPGYREWPARRLPISPGRCRPLSKSRRWTTSRSTR